MLPAPLGARPPAPKTGPSAKALPRGPSAVGGPCPPRRLAPRMDSPPDPRTAAGNSTMAANMAWPRAPVRPRVPKAPAWRQNHRGMAGRACSALKIVQKCPLGLQWPPNCHGSWIFHATGLRFSHTSMSRNF